MPTSFNGKLSTPKIHTPPIGTGQNDARETYIAPDGSRLFKRITEKDDGAEKASDAEIFLLCGTVSNPVMHKTVEEHWRVLDGEGEVWLGGKKPIVLSVKKGSVILIKTGTPFQFRNSHSTDPLHIHIVTIPGWPGPSEAITGIPGNLAWKDVKITKHTRSTPKKITLKALAKYLPVPETKNLVKNLGRVTPRIFQLHTPKPTQKIEPCGIAAPEDNIEHPILPDSTKEVTPTRIRSKL